MLNVDESVELQVRDLAHAALHVLRRALAHRGDHVSLLQELRGGVVLDRVGKLHFQIAVFLLQRRDGDAHRGLVLVVRPRQRQFQRERRAVREQRLHLQAVVAPLALQARDQRPFEGGVRLLFEQIHDRRAIEGVVLGVAEQLDPGAVGVHDDAFLHMRDGIGGTFEKVLQLLAIFARR